MFSLLSFIISFFCYVVCGDELRTDLAERHVLVCDFTDFELRLDFNFYIFSRAELFKKSLVGEGDLFFLL